MIFAYKGYSKETLSKNVQVPVRKVTGEKRYARLPADILRNPALTPAAKIIYQAMDMEAWGTGELAISHEALAQLCGVARSTVLGALKNLRLGNYIEPLGKRVKQIQPYRLLHPQYQRKAVTQALDVKMARKSAPVACKQCARLCRRLPESRICGACLRRSDTERVAARVAQRVATDVVDQRLNDKAATA